jgi:predicted amidohydrolase YtcJ
MTSDPPIYLIEMLITNATLANTDDPAATGPGAVAIDQGMVLWIGPAADAATVPAQEVLDARGAAIAPELCHVHFQGQLATVDMTALRAEMAEGTATILNRFSAAA